MNRLAIYLRCSTLDQNIDAQRHQLREWAKFRKLTIVEEYKDEGISGMKKREARPEFDRMMKDAAKGKFDIIAVWDVSRFGRSTAQVAQSIDELRELGIGLYASTQAIDTTTAYGASFMKLIGVFAELENTIRRERCEAGRIRARQKGKPLGRQVSDEPVEKVKDNQIADLLRAGKPHSYIRNKLKIGSSRIARVMKSHGLLDGY